MGFNDEFKLVTKVGKLQPEPPRQPTSTNYIQIMTDMLFQINLRMQRIEEKLDQQSDMLIDPEDIGWIKDWDNIEEARIVEK